MIEELRGLLGHWLVLVLVLGGALSACSDDDDGGGRRARPVYLDRSPAQLVADALSDAPSTEFLAVRGRVRSGVTKDRRTYTRSFVVAGGRGRALVDDVQITAARRQTAIALGVQLDLAKEQDAALAGASLEVLVAEMQRRVAGASVCEALGSKADDCVIVLLLLEVKRCEATASVDAAVPALDATVDALAPEASIPQDSGADALAPWADGALDASGSDAGGGDAGPSALPPQIAAITPTSTSAATQLSLTVTGSGFVPGATLYVDRAPLTTVVTSDTVVTASVSATLTNTPGDLAVFVENRAGDVDSRSNTLYLRVQPAPGAPVLYDYSPDNGVAGETILLIGNNLQGENLTVRDANGAALTVGASGSLTWPNVGSASSLAVVLPAGVATGPIVVSTTLGTFRGKVFNVGQNLTKVPGIVVSASSEYNQTNWSKASGADNSLRSSFFTSIGDCASMPSCTLKPWFKVAFPAPQTVQRIAMRGNREYASGYDFVRGIFTLYGAADAVLWQGTYDLPEPDRDLDIVLRDPLANVTAVQFSSLADQSSEPGFAELELFGP